MACTVGYLNRNVEYECTKFLDEFVASVYPNFHIQLGLLESDPPIGKQISSTCMYTFPIEIGVGAKKIIVYYWLDVTKSSAKILDMK